MDRGPIFISHSSTDKPFADAACARLEAAGHRCWIAPRDILPGADWGASIVRAIESCAVFVLIFSGRANASAQVRREVELAVARARPIIPVRIEDAMPTEGMAYFMGAVHWLDAMTPPIEAHMARLVQAVDALDAPGASLPPPLPPSPLPPAKNHRQVFLGVIGLAAAGVAGIMWIKPWKSLEPKLPTRFSHVTGHFERRGLMWIEQPGHQYGHFQFVDGGVANGYLLLVDPTRVQDADANRPFTIRIPIKGGMAQWSFPNPYIWQDLYLVRPE